jgi:hypothetical protein
MRKLLDGGTLTSPFLARSSRSLKINSGRRFAFTAASSCAGALWPRSKTLRPGTGFPLCYCKRAEQGQPNICGALLARKGPYSLARPRCPAALRSIACTRREIIALRIRKSHASRDSPAKSPGNNVRRNETSTDRHSVFDILPPLIGCCRQDRVA